MKYRLKFSLLTLVSGLVLFIYLSLGNVFNTQAQTVDRILAVVDDEVILQSDLERQYEYYTKNGKKDDGSLKCSILENLLSSKLILAKARIDSVVVSESQIDEEINQRVNGMIKQLNNSPEELERIYNKSIIELKLEMRPEITEQMIVEEQKRKIFSKIAVTPKEVKEFFNNIPKDSLPFLPAEVEMSHIVIRPKPSEENIKKSRTELEIIRGKILAGDLKFADAAALHSHDFGSAKQGGSLGKFGKGTMVPEFEEVIFSMKIGDVSKVFESPFGFHIIKLENRTLDEMEASHILIRPEISKEDEAKAINKLNQIRASIKKDSTSFGLAAEKFSADPQSKNNGGRIVSGNGEFRVPLDKLDADLYLKIDNMKEGDISEPMEIINAQGDITKAYHIVWLQKRTKPHKANLKDDYQKFAQSAKQNKQAEELNEWFQKTKKQVFIELKDNDCSQALQNWN